LVEQSALGYGLLGGVGVAVGAADAVGVGAGVLEGAGADFGVGVGLLSASQLTACIWGSGFEVSKTQRWAGPSSRFFRTSAPDPSVAAGVSARSWSQRGTRVPWRVKS
jgi:hypothetical protein